MKFCAQCQKEFEGEELYCNDCGTPLTDMLKLKVVDDDGAFGGKNVTAIRIKGNIMIIEKIDESFIGPDAVSETKIININDIIDMVNKDKIRYFNFILFIFGMFSWDLLVLNMLYFSESFVIDVVLLAFTLFVFDYMLSYVRYASLEIKLRNKGNEVIVIDANKVEKLNLILSFFKCNKAQMIEKRNIELGEEKVLNCSNCGHEFLKEHNFCQFCGKDANSHLVLCPMCCGKGISSSFLKKLFTIFLVYVMHNLIMTVLTEGLHYEFFGGVPCVVKLIILTAIVFWGMKYKKCSHCNGNGFVFSKDKA